MAPHSSTLAWKISWTEEPGCGHHGRDFGVWATSVSVYVDPGTLDTFGHVYPDQTVSPFSRS